MNKDKTSSSQTVRFLLLLIFIALACNMPNFNPALLGTATFIPTQAPLIVTAVNTSIPTNPPGPTSTISATATASPTPNPPPQDLEQIPLY